MPERKPPQVIHLSPPPIKARYVLGPIWWAVAIFLASFGLMAIWCGLWFVDARFSPLDRQRIPNVLFVIGSAVVVLLPVIVVQHFIAIRRIDRTRSGGGAVTNAALSQALWPQWDLGWERPRDHEILDALKHWEEFDEDTATVVCFPGVSLPEPGDYRSEPIVVTPSAGLSIQQWIAIAVLLVLFCLLQLGVFGGSSSPLIFFYFLVACVPLVFMTWRRLASPIYYRGAPGVIQRLHFANIFGGHPVIREYRMEPGTLAILSLRRTANRGWSRRPRGLCLEMLAKENKDTFHLTRADVDDETRENILRLLVSTAPIPPLSATELVG